MQKYSSSLPKNSGTRAKKDKQSGFPKDNFCIFHHIIPSLPFILFGDVNFSHSAKTVLPTFGKRQFVFTTGFEYMIFILRILTINLTLERKLFISCVYKLCRYFIVCFLPGSWARIIRWYLVNNIFHLVLNCHRGGPAVCTDRSRSGQSMSA